MAAPRARLIELLARRHPGRTRRELEALVIRGEVRVDGEPARAPGVLVREDAVLAVPPVERWVSRGGAKLDAALAAWDVGVADRVWLDAGSSTGGFTDCLLQRGASHVHCVDVGRGQLAWKLRGDARVSVHEGTNVMAIAPGDLVPPPDLAVADLSFRSLRGAAPAILRLARDGVAVVLAKPQFEWRDHPAGFHGVVVDHRDLALIVRRLVADLWDAGALTLRIMPSPIAGRRGNREFLLLLTDRPGADRAAMSAALDACLASLERGVPPER